MERIDLHNQVNQVQFDVSLGLTTVLPFQFLSCTFVVFVDE